MCAQTSVGGVAATTGGHGEEGGSSSSSSLRVASGQEIAGKREDEGVLSEDELLRSPTPGKGEPNPRREGRRALSQYKAALRLVEKLGKKKECSQVEQSRLSWARNQVEESRKFFEGRITCAPIDPAFCNRIEENTHMKLSEKRKQRSVDEENPTATKKPKKNVGSTPKTGLPTETPKPGMASEILKRHLTVALIDRSEPLGKMSLEKWKTVDRELVKAMFRDMRTDPKQPMPSFDGAGWLSGVKIIKCNDEYTLNWCRRTTKALTGLWEGADLEVVDRADIPSIPKAKVIIPLVVPVEDALELLKRQNPSIPTSDWKVLKVEKPMEKVGQMYVIQINKEADDMLYPKFGKMAWGTGSVYLRLKKRHPKDGNENTLEAGEVEKDLGLDTLAEAAMSMTLGVEDTATPDVQIRKEDPTQDVAGTSGKSAPQ